MKNLNLIKSSFVDYSFKEQLEGIEETKNDLEGANVAISGNFEYGNKTYIISKLEERGAIYQKGVIKTTDILIVGAKGSGNWRDEHSGLKIQKALKINSKGKKQINIACEKEFFNGKYK